MAPPEHHHQNHLYGAAAGATGADLYYGTAVTAHSPPSHYAQDLSQSIFSQPGSYAGPFSDNSPFGFGTGGAAGAGAFGTGDYNTWGAPAIISAAVSKAPLQASHQAMAEYYRGAGMAPGGGSGGAASVQHGMAALGLNDPAQRAYGGPPKKPTWATIASQPAKPTEKKAPAKPRVPIGNPGRPVIPEPSSNWGTSPTQTQTPAPPQPLQPQKQPSMAIPSKYKAVEGANPPARPQNGFASSQEDLLGPGDSKPAPKGLPQPQHQYTVEIQK